jgi:predicted MFS family arabinose efflux permease
LVDATVSEAHRRRLFVASCMALTATAVTFAIRGDILGDLGTRFSLTNEDLGKAAGAWAYGFTLSIFIGGQLVDLLGMKRIVAAAFLMHVLGVVLTIFATGFWTLFTGTLCVGLGNGLVEAFVNPLTATIYPDQKTEKLNLLHVWFPGGIVIGGLVAFGLALLNFGWQAKMAFILLPTLLYGALFLGQEFPATERVQQGVSTAGMYRAVLRPLFLVIVFCMILTASTELATNQWIAYILSNTAGMAAGGILVLVWINGLMAVGRWFAGPMVHRLSAIGLLIASATLSAIGLVGLSLANSPFTAIAAATVFAIGICYFWPTMLGVTSERFPDGGSLALAIVGGTGTLAAAIFTWILGGMYDRLGPRMALRYMAVLPVILIVVFSLIWLHDRRGRGGAALDAAGARRVG